jgi:Cdc6-like AAA superfamily ATPase
VQCGLCKTKCDSYNDSNTATITRSTGRVEGFNTNWNISNFYLSTKLFDSLYTEKIQMLVLLDEMNEIQTRLKGDLIALVWG